MKKRREGKRWNSSEDGILDIIIKNHIPLNKLGSNRKSNDKLIDSSIGKWNTTNPNDVTKMAADLVERTTCAVRGRLEWKLQGMGYNAGNSYFYKKIK